MGRSLEILALFLPLVCLSLLPQQVLMWLATGNTTQQKRGTIVVITATTPLPKEGQLLGINKLQDVEVSRQWVPQVL